MLGNLNYLSLTGETLGPKRVWVQSTTKHPACGGGTYPSNSPTPQGVGTHKLPQMDAKLKGNKNPETRMVGV